MYKEFTVSFHKGLRENGSPRIFEDGECSIAQDCYFDELGNIYSRKFINVVSSFDDKIKTIFPYNYQNRLLISTKNGNLYDYNESINNSEKLISNSIGSDKLSCVEYNNIAYLFNKFCAKAYNGVSIRNVGNPAPTIAPVVSVINKVIDNATTNWTASANVTSSVDEHNFKVSPSSIKLDVALAFTTGVIAYHDFSEAIDLSSYTHIGFWFKSSKDLSTGDIEFLLDDTPACVSPLDTIDIPASSVNTWKWIEIEIPTGLTSVKSIGLNMPVDIGVVTLRIDKITAVLKGNLNGTYYYKYRYVDKNNKESSDSPISEAISLNDEYANIEVFASPSSEIIKMNLYRLGGTLTDWYFVRKISKSSQDDIQDNKADTDLITLCEDNINDPPPAGLSYIVEHYERLIGVKDNTYPNSINFTKEYEPEYWGNNYNQQYLVSNSDPCTGLVSWGRYLILWKINKIYIIENTDPTKWNITKSSSNSGNIAPFAVKCFNIPVSVLASYSLPLYINYSGWFAFDGNKEIYLSDKVRNFFKTNKRLLPNAISELHDNKFYLLLPDYIILIYDFIQKIFYTQKLKLSEISYNYLNNFLYAGDENNNLVKLEQDINVDSYDSVDFKIKSKAYPLHDVPNMEGSLRNFILCINTKNQDVLFNIYIDGVLVQTITINTSHVERLRRSFNSNLTGRFVEFEFVYSGTKQIYIELPIIINPKDKLNV